MAELPSEFQDITFQLASTPGLGAQAVEQARAVVGEQGNCIL